MQDTLGTLGTLLLFVAIVAALWLIFVRGNEIFFVSVRGGRALLIRGRIPPNLLSQIADVARRSGVASGSVTAYKAEARARIVTSGFDENDQQRLRNLFALHPVSTLRAAKLTKPENIGQVFGIAWLAWMLAGRR
jgi:hypothetical protein